MKESAPFTLTEWEWFKLQLRLYAIERSAGGLVARFTFDDENHTAKCAVWCKTTQELIDKKADKERQLLFYENWVEVESAQIATLLQQLPALSKQFDVGRDIRFEILYDYGMGSSLVCEFNAGEVMWHREM